MPPIYADHNVSRESVLSPGRLDYRVSSLREMALERAKDDELLLIAAEHASIFLTHNTADFILLHDAWRRWSVAWNVFPRHAGILIAPQEWRGERVANELDGFLRTSPSLENELYRRRAVGTWERRPAPPKTPIRPS